MSADYPDKEGQTEGEIQTIVKAQKPKMFKVILLNDDFTPMDFVVFILKRIFSKSDSEAEKIMLEVHQKGAGTAGVYTYEIAEMKAIQVHQLARKNQHPLKAKLEEE